MNAAQQRAKQQEIGRILAVLEAASLKDRRRFLWKRVKPKYPRYFYKYRSISAQGAQVDPLRGLLIDSAFYLSSPRDFNDPFEFRANVAAYANVAQRRKKFSEFLKANQPSLRWKARQQMVTKWLQIPLEDWKDRAYQAFNKQGNELGVASLSTQPRNVLMWSHYADHHRGVCLQFEVARDPRVFLEAIPIEYSDEFPELNWFAEDMPNQIRACILRKKTDWRYEEEHRIVRPGSAGSLLPFRPDALSGIIMGANMAAPLQQRLAALLEERRSLGFAQPIIYKASRINYEIALSRIPF